MGYRSDVYMCITGPKDTILAGLATLRIEGDQTMHTALDEWSCTQCHESPDRAVLVLGGQGTDWKWYDSYPYVQAHSAIFEHFAELAGDDEQLHGIFIRIGEDDDDIESREFNEGYELGTVVRRIDRAYDGSGIDLRHRLAIPLGYSRLSLDDMKKTL